MPFVRKKTKVYSWPVKVQTPSTTKVGEFETTKFTGKFNRLSRTELNNFEEATENINSDSARCIFYIYYLQANKSSGKGFNLELYKICPNSICNWCHVTWRFS